MAYLSVQGLSNRYGEAIAVQGFSLEVEQGAFVSLLGPSGSGKSSVLRMIAGLTLVDAGSVAVDGRDVTALPARQRCFGYVFQSYALFPHLSARRNVAFPMQVARVPRREREETIERLLQTVEELRSRVPKTTTANADRHLRRDQDRTCEKHRRDIACHLSASSFCLG